MVQPSEVLHKRPILVERGSFRPATRLTVDTHTAQNPDRLVLQVIDNGQGMDLDTPREGGQGLANMRARAVAVGATLAIRSTPGEGTCVQVELPMRVGSPAAD